MSYDTVDIGSYQCGPDQPLLVIAGPCVLEDQAGALEIAEVLRRLNAELPIQVIFKASFDKANRTSIESYRGPGLEQGLKILAPVSYTHLTLPTKA